MNAEKLLELEKIIEEQSEKITALLDNTPLGEILNELHYNFYHEANEAIQTALRIEKNFTNHINNKKDKNHAHTRKFDVF